MMALQADGPDKGRSWLVAAAVFSIHLIFGGIFRSQGIFFVEFINVYGVDRRKASIPFSLYATIRHLCGFIAGIMGQKYGCRCLIIIGGILASVNTALCFFATSIEWYIVLWGIMNGLITSLTTILPHVVILQYFIKYRTTATGLGFTGGCIGSFLFPVILEVLLYSYGLNGTFLLLSSIMMHAIPAAMILKSPPWSIDKNGQVTFKDQTHKDNTSEFFPSNSNSQCKCECGSQFKYDTFHESHEVQKDLREPKCHQLSKEQSPSVSSNNLQYEIHKVDLQRSCPSNKKFSTEDRTCLTSKTDPSLHVDINYLKKNKDIVCNVLCMEISNSDIRCKSVLLEQHLSHPDNDDIMQEIENMYSKILTYDKISKSTVPNMTLKRKMLNDSMTLSSTGELARTEKKYHEADSEKLMQHLGEIRSETNIAKTYLELTNKEYVISKLKQMCYCNEINKIISNLWRFNRRDVSEVIFQMQVLYKIYSSVEVHNHCESVGSPEPTETKESSANLEVICTNVSKKPANSFKHHIKAALYLHKKAIFILISCTRVAFFVSFSPVLTFIVDFAMDKGLHEEDGKFILGALSFGDILGRMCLGWITDSGYVSLPRYMFGGMVILSVCLASMPFFYSRWAILCGVALFALLQGSLYVRHPGLVGKYLNSDEQSIAMGCMDFFAGIITLFVPLYIGYFRDHIGSYDAIFYINGLLVLLTAIGWFFESRLVSSNNFPDKAFPVV